eukprot:516435-Prymnesium_polylepis.1
MAAPIAAPAVTVPATAIFSPSRSGVTIGSKGLSFVFEPQQPILVCVQRDCPCACVSEQIQPLSGISTLSSPFT